MFVNRWLSVLRAELARKKAWNHSKFDARDTSPGTRAQAGASCTAQGNVDQFAEVKKTRKSATPPDLHSYGEWGLSVSVLSFGDDGGAGEGLFHRIMKTKSRHRH